MGALAGPQQVVAAASAAVDALAPALSLSGARGSRSEWAAALAELQRAADVVAAAQDATVVALAAIEEEYAEDGSVVEAHRAPGYVALDAGALVSEVLSLSAVHAERRVRAAVLLAADGPEGSPTSTGLGGLHAAMAAGRLDAYRASVVADELEEAPAEVAAGVVAALEPHLAAEDAPSLRRRCRRVLARVSPDLVRERAVRARTESRLERWVGEPGVDTWHGTFPSGEASRAWAAVDRLAQRYLAEGECPNIGRARAKALTDLVEGSATIETVVTLVVPHDPTEQSPEAAPPPSPVTPVTGLETLTTPQPGLLAAGSGEPVARKKDGAIRSEEDGALRSRKVGTLRSEEDGALRSRKVGTLRLPEEGTLRSPATAAVSAAPAGDDARSAGNRSDLVEVPGTRAGEPVLVERGWLEEAIATTRIVGRDRRGRTTLAKGHPRTGALIDPIDELATEAYRPGERLVALVRARDRRCRFPGCHVAARFCDVDHVRPWPHGPTSAGNLVCLCRRHHRIKQRPGWRVHLDLDGTLTWTGPTGLGRTTVPADVLHPTVLPAGSPGGSADATAGGEGLSDRPTGRLATVPRPGPRDDPHSGLEFALEHLVGNRWRRPPVRCDVHRGRPLGWAPDDHPHRGRRRGVFVDDGPPPF